MMKPTTTGAADEGETSERQRKTHEERPRERREDEDEDEGKGAEGAVLRCLRQDAQKPSPWHGAGRDKVSKRAV